MTNSSMKLVALVFISVAASVCSDPLAQFVGARIAELARIVGQ